MRTLVKPLRKLSLLAGPLKSSPSPPPASEDNSLPDSVCVSQDHGFIMRLPGELLLQVFSMLRYEHLVQVQLCCRSWKCLAQDASLWKERCRSITQQHQDLDERKDTSLSWLQRYCQLRTGLHWKLGIVERATLINISSSRLLSVKLRGKLLLTLSEDNMVHLYEYDTAQGFVSRCTWKFCGQRQVECIDLLPEINTVVVACRGSKCYFYDISSKSPTEPIQVLKGGSHAWFIPDDVSLTCDYFAVSGRKPSAVFVWNWRKGVQLALKALNNEPHAVHISGDHLMTVSGEGNVEVQHLFEDLIYPVTQVPPCSIPSHNYDGQLYLLVAPFSQRSLYQFSWPQLPATTDWPTPRSSTTPSLKRRLSTSINLFGSSKYSSAHRQHHACQPNQTDAPPLMTTKTKKSSTQKQTSRPRRHSSYNNYGYACQTRTDQYIKYKERHMCQEHAKQPDFNLPMTLQRTIRTAPLGNTALGVINITSYRERVATVNRHGDIAIYKQDGTMGAQVQCKGKQPWLEALTVDGRDDDDLSDGYDFMRSRLAMGPMGIIYGSKNGSLWWMDFSLPSVAPTSL